MEQTNSPLLTILRDYIRLSSPTKCENCGRTTKFIGETRKFGNWYCPYCEQHYPYKENPNIVVDVPFVKLTDQLQNERQPFGAALLGDPVTTEFPMDTETGFLVPSFGYKISRKKNVLLAQAIDFTRFGRIKSGNIWQFDLVWNDRPVAEFETLVSFCDTQGYHLPFIYNDQVRHSTHICFFDSDVEAPAHSFDGMSFSVRITE